ncbi:kinase-like protein [Diplogelasinospora grovesii]|uniref:Kinase-like protein n=1 Tax=Diplogelasinospora grovesii TaxID=303347 RepID=A0AAN6NDJ4_9PEZI|nr:kinase-like protein [Diplogelasinospora grovesii]
MPLNRLASHTPFSRHAYRTSIRLASTIMGKSGRVYVQGEALQRRRENPNFGVFKAESGNESFVFKRVPRPFYDLALRLAAEFTGSRRLRMHIDCNPEEDLLVYPYFRGTLLGLIQEDPDFPPAERQRILRRVAEAIQELHSKDWIHIEGNNKTVTDVALGDFDTAFKSEGGEPRQTPHAIGNVMWRSPEGQTGRGVTKASDVFSFGLVCIYALGGGEFLLLNDYQKLVKHGIMPEMAIHVRHFSYFGLVPEGLLKQVNDEAWCKALKGASRIAEETVREQPELRFERWGEELGSEALNMISGMTNPDPTARITIDQVLTHPWWHEANT